jgi:23S rRNA 5-hydroxycytidine C2501 synthase
MDNRVELLAPARDLACGMAAVTCGADAVYMGAPRFGARENAGNSLGDIADLTRFAHRYHARVYATVNTLLHDRELDEAVGLIHRLWDLGIDGVIIQDTGLLERDLPPVPLIASTQMHNHTPGRVAFLEGVGFRRVILARELDLPAIRQIRAATSVGLECFIHGALCVGHSGQCAMSHAAGGRSGNRGQCAQPCRKCYRLVDAQGKTVAHDRYLLSLHDLNLSDHLGALLDAGVRSFKIEGRLKDIAYVRNVVGWYRTLLDQEIRERGLQPASSGRVTLDFQPDPERTFNRGFTSYYINGRGEPVGSIDTPKMTGPLMGVVRQVSRREFSLDRPAEIVPGDGLCFFDDHRELRGTLVNAVRDRWVSVDNPAGLKKGVEVFRNHDHAFTEALKNSRSERRIGVGFTLEASPGLIWLTARDEDGIEAEVVREFAWSQADQPGPARETIVRQLARTGASMFRCDGAEIGTGPAPFLPVSMVNALRRDTLDMLGTRRIERHPREQGEILRNNLPYPEPELDYRGNVLNRSARAFYERHGVRVTETAAESGLDLRDRVVMSTRYCIRHQLGLCTKGGEGGDAGPLYLEDADGNRYEVRFECERCGMDLVKTR